MTLIHNERTKLTANALDRIGTALIALGVLGQALSLSPATATLSKALNMCAWFFGALILHLMAQRVLGRLKT